jgi:peptide/nickel transport system substrate-binding protein
VVAVAISLLAAACGGGGGESARTPDATSPTGDVGDEGTPVRGGTVVWGLEAETDGLNPISGRWALSGHMMGSAIFDPLAVIDDEGVAVPFLAESFEANDDFTEWTIVVRSGVRFHDGTPLTAGVVADTLMLHKDSAVTQKAVYDMASATAVDDRTVKVTMSRPWSTFPYILTTQAGYIPAPSMLDVPEEARTPIGTGPFKFQNWDYGRSFTATRNPDYWARDENGVQLPYLDGIEFRPIVDPQARTEALIEGDVDAINTWTPAEIRRLAATPDVKLLTFSEGEEEFVMLNASKAPFDRLTARQAVAYATDAASIRDALGTDYMLEATSLWAPGQLGATDDDGYLRFDRAKAAELVQQYQAETGRPLAFSLIGASDQRIRELQQLLKQQWEAAGMQVELLTVDQADLVVNGALGNYQATIWRNYGHPDPDVELVWFHSRSIGDPVSLNFSRFSHAELDAAFERGRTTQDEAVRADAYAEVARIINQNAIHIWLDRVTWAIASQPDVNGYGPAANGSIQTLGPKPWVGRLWKS